MKRTEAQQRADERRRIYPRPERGDGLCQCGCGQKTKIAGRTSARDGTFRGYPLTYLHGHHLKGRTPGRFVNTAGYVLVHAPNHPDAYKQKGYVLEHRLVMEDKLGRRLEPHINHQKTDNRSENLELVDRVSHGRKHGRPRGTPMTPEQRERHRAVMRQWWAERRAKAERAAFVDRTRAQAALVARDLERDLDLPPGVRIEWDDRDLLRGRG
jgi:hypothetical protein